MKKMANACERTTARLGYQSFFLPSLAPPRRSFSSVFCPKVNDIGMEPLMDSLLKLVVAPLAAALYGPPPPKPGGGGGGHRGDNSGHSGDGDDNSGSDDDDDDECSGDGEVFASSLDHHHSFVVAYAKAPGGDRGLDMHHDASEVSERTRPSSLGANATAPCFIPCVLPRR